MSKQPRSFGPAISMGVAILLSIALIALAPFHMVGSWNDGSDSAWNRLSSQIEEQLGTTNAELTLLEELPDGTFLYAAQIEGRGPIAGIAGPQGTGGAYGENMNDDDVVGVAFGSGDDQDGPTWRSLTVHLTGSAEQPYRYEYFEFDTDQELDAYMDRLNRE